MQRTDFVDRVRQLMLVAVVVITARLSWEYAAPFCAEKLGEFWDWLQPIATVSAHAWQTGGFWTRLQLVFLFAMVLWIAKVVGSAIWNWRDFVEDWLPEIICEIGRAAAWAYRSIRKLLCRRRTEPAAPVKHEGD